MFRNIAWVAVLITSVLLVSNASADNPYVGDNAVKCAMCHKAQVDAWKKWPMANAWAKLQADKGHKDSCIPCHVTGYGKPGGFVSFEKTPKLVNVQCEACHGPAGDHMKVPLTDKAKKKATMTNPTESTCTACHNKKSPNYKPFTFADFKKKLADHLPKK